MAKYQKYAEYKDSGVRWLGFVPSHWVVAGFKKYLESTVDYRGKTPEKMEEGIFLVTARNIKNGIIDYSLSQEYVAIKDYDEIMSRGKPLLGDVLFTTEAPLGEVAQIDSVNIALAQRIIKFRGKSNILDNAYLKYFILSQQFQDSLMTFATGSTALGIKAERLGYLQQYIPPIHEQLKITNFLDHETAKINLLIAKQEKLIELLKEKRQAVISHAVTKGLNPNVAMKDSGVEWLGEVPGHWIVKRLKHISPKIGVGLVINPSTYTREEGVYFIFGGDVKEYEFDLSKTRRISKHDSDNLLPSRLNHRDLVSIRVGYPGVTAVVTKELEGANCASIIVIRRGKYNSDWLCAAMNIWVGRQQVELASYGAAQKQFNVADAIEFKFPVPPANEQDEIAIFVEETRKKFDNLSNKALQQIELLKERRTALISAAVTGKIDVRNWQHPNQKNNTHTELSA
ncbi:restriction endonuclease subunit S [Acinetobacter radioresistens]|uniref:restriction endonuclease subunit S n=1 Tax=Acinetobacter radioresistens TaxID=40216 RepID=UPI002005D1A4|nr:restriction endonuclease subunit S [Acinetobacter radioresistens]MCK4107723.1 hypothetical protein [Acinetobacter radioresistens]